jgi:integrase
VGLVFSGGNEMDAQEKPHIENVQKPKHGANYKRQINKLDIDFRAKLVAKAYEDESKYADILALLWATGCRPAELEKGISFGKYADGWGFTIQGCKINEEKKRGQEKRVFKLDVVDEQLKARLEALYKRLYKNDQKPAVFQLSEETTINGLAKYTRRLSQKLWPRRKEHVSPYSFRHALATDLKNATGLSRSTVAQVLGHRSEASQDAYGRKGGKSKSPVSVKSAKATKEIKKVDAFARFKKKAKVPKQPNYPAAGVAGPTMKSGGFKP